LQILQISRIVYFPQDGHLKIFIVILLFLLLLMYFYCFWCFIFYEFRL